MNAPRTRLSFCLGMPTMRFNTIVGNAHAGLRIGANQTVRIDASCNYLGSAEGPSGGGPGSGDRYAEPLRAEDDEGLGHAKEREGGDGEE